MTQHNKNFNANDILLKFVDTSVHDSRKNARQAVSNRLHFENFAKNKEIHKKVQENRKKHNKDKTTKHFINKNDFEHRIHHDDALFELRIRYLTIDSRDRDTSLYPFAHTYSLDISKHALTNVVSAELVSSTFINTQLPVRYNNLIHWNFEDDVDDNGVLIPYQAEVPVQPYENVNDLLQVMQTTMNSVSRHLDTKMPHTFEFGVEPDYSIRISAYEWGTANDDGISISSVVGDNLLYIFWPSHGLAVTDSINIQNVQQPIGGIVPSSINGNTQVNTVIDVNNFTVVTNIVASVADIINTDFEIGIPLFFQLLFAEPNSIGPILKFPEENTGFEVMHSNNTETLEASFSLFDDQYIVMCSHVLSGLFETVFVTPHENIDHDCPAPFAIIQMGGKYHDTVFNSYVGGKKVFYNNSIDSIERVDFQFRYHNGDLVDFENSDHSFVIKFIQSIHKVQNVDFNTKIGSSTHTFTRKIRHPIDN